MKVNIDCENLENIIEAILNNNIDKTISEWDTGYREYGCSLLNSDCYGEYCPMTFKYNIYK